MYRCIYVHTHTCMHAYMFWAHHGTFTHTHKHADSCTCTGVTYLCVSLSWKTSIHQTHHIIGIYFHACVSLHSRRVPHETIHTHTRAHAKASVFQLSEETRMHTAMGSNRKKLHNACAWDSGWSFAWRNLCVRYSIKRCDVPRTCMMVVVTRLEKWSHTQFRCLWSAWWIACHGVAGESAPCTWLPCGVPKFWWNLVCQDVMCIPKKTSKHGYYYALGLPKTTWTVQVLDGHGNGHDFMEEEEPNLVDGPSDSGIFFGLCADIQGHDCIWWIPQAQRSSQSADPWNRKASEWQHWETTSWRSAQWVRTHWLHSSSSTNSVTHAHDNV